MPQSPGTGESGVSPILALSRTQLRLFQQAAICRAHRERRGPVRAEIA